VYFLHSGFVLRLPVADGIPLQIMNSL